MEKSRKHIIDAERFLREAKQAIKEKNWSRVDEGLSEALIKIYRAKSEAKREGEREW